jgi:hypothetical protein
MNSKRTTKCATWLWSVVVLATLLLPTASALVHPLAPLETARNASGAWIDQACTPPARASHAMAPLGGNRLLLFGGEDANGYGDET